MDGGSATEKTKEKKIYIIRRSIFLIFVLFSAIVMLISLSLLVKGLCHDRLLEIINEGARPPTLLNLAIMSEAGSTIALDSIA